MEVTFGFVTNIQYYDDYSAASSHNATVSLTIDVAQTGPLIDVPVQSFQWNLLDGAGRQLKGTFRRKQKITTYPDLLLKSAMVGKTKMTYYDFLSLWWRMESRWIMTDRLGQTPTKPGPGGRHTAKQMVRVMRRGDLEPQRHDSGSSFLVFAEFEVETTKPVADPTF